MQRLALVSKTKKQASWKTGQRGMQASSSPWLTSSAEAACHATLCMGAGGCGALQAKEIDQTPYPA